MMRFLLVEREESEDGKGSNGLAVLLVPDPNTSKLPLVSYILPPLRVITASLLFM